MALILLPALLAQEAGGAKRIEVEAATLGEALRALAVADLVLDERGTLRPLVNVYVDGERVRDLELALAPTARIQLVAAVAGG